MTMASATATEWKCRICQDDKGADDDRITIHDDHECCKDCFENGMVPKFQEALDHEIAYPLKWANKVLSPSSFRSFFDENFLTKWQTKKKERAIPFADRIYCQHQLVSSPTTGRAKVFDPAQADAGFDKKLGHCNAFLGEKVTSAFRSAQTCSNCLGHYCTACGSALSRANLQTACEQHVVRRESQDPVKGLVKGRDFQICPGQPGKECGRMYNLKEACNHMTCAAIWCGADFCYICGVRAAGDSGHWRSGCPQYGQPGEPGAQFEGAHNELEEGEIGDADPWAEQVAYGHEDVEDDRMGMYGDPNQVDLDTLEEHSELARWTIDQGDDETWKMRPPPEGAPDNYLGFLAAVKEVYDSDLQIPQGERPQHWQMGLDVMKHIYAGTKAAATILPKIGGVQTAEEAFNLRFPMHQIRRAFLSLVFENMPRNYWRVEPDLHIMKLNYFTAYAQVWLPITNKLDELADAEEEAERRAAAGEGGN